MSRQGAKNYDVCIVGLKCFDQLTGAPVPKYLGGIERQLVTLARALVAEGLSVRFIVFGPAGFDQDVDGVSVVSAFEEGAGPKGLRFLTQGAAIVREIRRARPRAVLQMGSGVETAQAAIGSMLSPGAQFTYLVASDIDCRPDLLAGYTTLDRLGYRFGLRSARSVLAQTRSQQQALETNFNQASTVFALPYARPTGLSDIELETPADVIWVGRLTPEKRPDWVLALAERLPQLSFALIGSANADTDYAADMSARIAAAPNVRITGKVSDDELHGFYRGCSVLCCTSIVEGFPTTFLEAWHYGKPVVTSFDPDGVVAANQLGAVSEEVGGLAGALQSFVDGGPEADEVRSAIARYFDATYQPAARARQLAATLGLD